MTEPQSSTIPTAVTALHDLLADVQWPDRPTGGSGDVCVEVSSELRDMGREVILLGQIRGDQEFTAIGARSRDEDYTVDMFVVVRWPGDNGLQAMDRAWQIFAQIELLLASPQYVALAQSAGVAWNELKRPQGTPTTEDEGAGHVIASAVRFRSRIRPRGDT